MDKRKMVKGREKIKFLSFLFIFLAKSLVGQNLVKNGDFEKGDPNKELVHGRVSQVENWAAYFYPWTGCSASWERGNAHSGDYSVKITIPQEAKPNHTIAWCSSLIPVKESETFNISFWMKLKGVKAGTGWHKPGAMVVFFDENKNRIRHWDMVRVGEENTPWRKYEKRIKIPKMARGKKVAFIKVHLVVSFCPGEVWFDDVEVLPIKEESSLTILDKDLAKKEVVIIPEPRKVKLGYSRILLKNLKVLVSPEFVKEESFDFIYKEISEFFFKKKVSMGNYRGKIISSPKETPLILANLSSFALGLPDEEKLGDQGYFLKVGDLEKDKKGIMLAANSLHGIYYGWQSLKQILNKDKTSLQEIEIIDWPAFKYRGVPRGSLNVKTLNKMASVKLNFFWICQGSFGCREWERPMREGEKSFMKGFLKECKKRFITAVASYRPGWGKIEFHFSDPKHIEAVKRRYSEYYQCGYRIFSLSFDDLGNIGRDKLSYPDDIKRFKNIGNAHYFLASIVYRHLKKLNSENQLYIVPMYYYDQKNLSPFEKEYVKTLANLPKDVVFINCSATTKESVDYFKKLTSREPFIWINYFAQYEKMNPMPTFVPPLSFKYSPDLNKYTKGFIFLMPGWKDMLWYLAADFTWNIDRYNPKKSASLAIRKIAGKQDYNMLALATSFLDGLKNYPLSGTNKEEKVLFGKNMINTLKKWKSDLEKSLSQKYYRFIDKEIDNKIAVYKVILEDMEKRESPASIPKIKPPLIDGNISADEWKDTTSFKGFILPYRYWSKEDKFPQADTEVFVGYDERNLYLGFKCKEPYPEKLKKRNTEHDSAVYTDDCVEVFLQPPGKDYYHIAINSIGTIYDAKRMNKNWNGNYKVASGFKEDYWELEIAISFESLGISPKKGDRWNFNFARERYAGKTEVSSWCLLLSSFHEPERFWTMEFN